MHNTISREKALLLHTNRPHGKHGSRSAHHRCRVQVQDPVQLLPNNSNTVSKDVSKVSAMLYGFGSGVCLKIMACFEHQSTAKNWTLSAIRCDCRLFHAVAAQTKTTCLQSVIFDQSA